MDRVNFEPKGLFDLNQKLGNGLFKRFIFPPFSILRTYDVDWKRRKKQWLALGIESELGREDVNSGKLFKGKETRKKEKWESGKPIWINNATSVFDPVLCELMYSWFCPKNGLILDPFAGGSVRGIVASFIGYDYWGCELRKEQVKANYKQGLRIIPNKMPVWIQGDSAIELKNAPLADFIFSCPPYGNLEVYSDLEDDISNKNYPEFLSLYRYIIKQAVLRLKSNHFACFVVSNYRDKNGFLHDLVGDTIRAFERNECHLYNEIILATAIGSLPVRTGRQFETTRKIGKSHQNILIFYKGENTKTINATFNEATISEQRTRTRKNN